MTPPAGIFCPHIDRLVEALADGRPGAAERLDAHAATCPACAAEATFADDDAGLADTLSCLNATPCPPSVVAAALAAARSEPARRTLAADRPAADRTVALQTRRPVWRATAAVALLAAAVVAVFVAQPDVPAGPLVAEVPAFTTPIVAPPEPSPEPTRLAEVPARPSRAVRGSAPRRAPIPESLPPVANAPVTPGSTNAALPEPLVAEATPADSLAARESLALAFGIVARAQRAADAAVSDELRRVSTALAPTRLL